MPYKPKALLAVLKSVGFIEHHQTGSHLHLRHPDGRRIVLPMHNATMKKGILISILKDAGLTLDALRKS